MPESVGEVAASIGAGLARAALAGKVNGKLVDLSARIENDSDVAIITEKDADTKKKVGTVFGGRTETGVRVEELLKREASL